MKYKGYETNFETLDQGPDEAPKMWYAVKTPQGDEIQMDGSSWGDNITQEIFELWIDLGCPDRYHAALSHEGRFIFAPLDSNDLEKIRMGA